MINYVLGNLLEAEVDALVNTVNTVGIMGKGIALQFKRVYPENFKVYAKAVKHGEVKLGKMFVYKLGELRGPCFIINFPTKGHWKSMSRLEDIETGLTDLIKVIQRYSIQSIAVPALGCGNGGLRWNDVQPMIEGAARSLPQVLFLVYPPQDVPRPQVHNWLESHAAD